MFTVFCIKVISYPKSFLTQRHFVPGRAARASGHFRVFCGSLGVKEKWFDLIEKINQHVHVWQYQIDLDIPTYSYYRYNSFVSHL